MTMSSYPRIGYVVKRFPRVSETFIAQEILELERRGAAVRVFPLVENDRPADHAWLDDLQAPISPITVAVFSQVWAELGRRCRISSAPRSGIRRAVCVALEHPQGKGRRYLSEALALAELVERYDIDHLHAHFANRPAFVAMLAGLITGRPFSFTAHAKDIYTEPTGDVYWRELVRHASFVATVTEANVRHLRGMVGESLAGKIRLLYNGVDLQTIRPREKTAHSSPPRLLCVARLVEKKGVEVLVDAAALLRDRGVAFECAVVGDGPLASDMRNRASAAGLDERVRFIGPLAHERVIEQIHASDVVVLPCRIAADGDRDALPTVLLEAMACGVPCVSTPVGGVGEIIRQNETGILVRPDRADELALALRRLIEDETLRDRFGRAGRRRAETLFDRRRSVKQLHEWFGGAIDPRDERVGERSTHRRTKESHDENRLRLQ